jgi:hypothetical protein
MVFFDVRHGVLVVFPGDHVLDVYFSIKGALLLKRSLCS